ncbi:hypothetical protein [Xanthobacter sp.]|uniref:hypothetical protein n=1 Tax=Xanthobacter sp. TaxID=35809 RepID=UPI0025CBD594|nr:hypothetical protein [Xanthobacter sp.]
MTREDFEHFLIRFGTDVSRWPQDTRAAAEALLATDAAARALLTEETALERRLWDAARLTTAADTRPAQRVTRALSNAPLPRQSRRHPVRWLPDWLIALDLRPAWPSIAALAGMALLGFMVGSSDTLVGIGAGARGGSATDVSAVVFEPGPIGEGVL